MIFFSIITCLFFNYSTVSTSVKERHCNFSRYILNYFIHCERYLLRLNKTVENISEEDLKKYGEAIQSHSNIILLMLAELHCLECDYLPRDLMAVNLYLNNVSGSVNIISKNISNNNTKENKIVLLLEGYQRIHENISQQLLKYINYQCTDEVELLFVNYPKIIDEHCNLNIEQLVLVTKDLKNKIMKEININLCTRNSKKLYNPKNVILYDLFSHQPIVNEKNFMNGSQKRQIKANITDDYLDLLRYTPLHLKCADGSNLTLLDAFRFIKFHFYHHHVQSFQKLVRYSIIYPNCALLVQYLNFITSLKTSTINSIFYYENIRPCITLLSYTVIECLNKLKDLNILNEASDHIVTDSTTKVKELLHNFNNWPIRDNNIISNIFKSLKNVLFDKGIKYEMEFTIITTQDNFDDNYNNILKFSMQVKKYIKQLAKYKYLLNSQFSLHKKMKRGNSRQRNFLTNEVIENLCKDDLYKTLNRTHDLDENEDDWVNDDKFAELGFVKIETSLSSFYNDASIDGEAIKLYNETLDASTYVSCYMVDYLMYTIVPTSSNNR
ncbi:uncharacterized protein LOC126907520 isoform X2 [Daktulosphaira vitifoliae]|uniref:uncharacterized protein LOC126907520 isoform X2 n=1 Tax=Daktulosphaira vitifoliae TaxID=58002 RepID=UPI0021A99DBC|nr:uncharacterized protein LOC126907520 isoform X2 [Daktulosphaira vitifoliae]